MITASCYKPDPDTYLETFDDFTSSIGFVLYGLFTFVCVTVLINTLIAMLEESIDQIDDRADIEWKFARSKLYMEYIRKGNDDGSIGRLTRTIALQGMFYLCH